MLVSFDEFISEDFFKDYPKNFWYVWGDVFNRHKIARPHLGYQKLSEIIDLANKRDKYFIYHSGVDKFYRRSVMMNPDKVKFDENRYVQAKGSVVDFQGCHSCENLNRDTDMKVNKMSIDFIKGEAERIPICDKCKKPTRPNINLRSDLGWVEGDI